MATYTGNLTASGLPELATDGEIDFPAMTVRRSQHVTLFDAAGREIELPTPTGSDIERPAYVTQPDGDLMHVKVDDGSIRPDLSRFPNSRLPVDLGSPVIAGAVTVTNFPAAAPATTFPDRFDLQGDALGWLEALADSVVAKMRARTRAGWIDVAGEPGGSMYALGGHPDAQSYEWSFSASQTNQVLLAGTPGVTWKVVEAKATTSNATAVAVACRIGWSSTGSLPTLTSNSLIPVQGTAISEAGIPTGTGIVHSWGGIVSKSAPGDSLLITCGAATSGALRIKLVMFPVRE